METWIEKRPGERLKVAVSEFSGKRYVDLRLYFQAGNGDWMPTKKGVTLPLEKLAELKEAVGKLADEETQAGNGPRKP